MGSLCCTAEGYAGGVSSLPRRSSSWGWALRGAEVLGRLTGELVALKEASRRGYVRGEAMPGYIAHQLPTPLQRHTAVHIAQHMIASPT